MLRTLILVFISVVGLIIAYPQIEWGPLAWVALVPLLFAIDGKKAGHAFGWAYLCGFLFFAGTLGWMIYVTYPGAVLLIAYLSIYFALFGLCFFYFQKLPLLPRIFMLAAAWTVLEFIRSNVFTGFGWVTLGHSQYKNYFLVQIADITGVYGVSFLVMLVNILVFESMRPVFQKQRHDFRAIYWAQGIITAILWIVLGYGFYVVTRPHAWPTVKVGVVQPNIPQELKWDASLQPWVVRKTLALTDIVQKEKPDLIIWPETSFPGILWDSPVLLKEVKRFVQAMKIPLMIGSVNQDEGKYYNTAMLMSPQGDMSGHYDKIHLVPFGEYLPFRPLLGGIIDKIVQLEDFTSGTKYKIFEAGCPQKTFGVLICFEDTVSYLRRNFVKSGAGFLVNMTNDAWFKDTKAPFLHLQAAVLGCIENKRALVRCANTGVSVFIDPFGRMTGAAHDAKGKMTFVPGVAAAVVPIVNAQTFYTKYGDVFTLICLLGILWGNTVLRRFYA